MRAMALDVGQRRIGIALSDPDGSLAYARGVIKRGKLNRDLDEIAAVVEEEEVAVVVVGLPRSLDGTLGPQAERVQRFADLLRQRLSVPVEFWDERLSTVAANRALEEAGVPARERRDRIDAAAAALILQTYLDYRRHRNIANDAEED
ncbi:MAG: Holliday junction resolvase RuvX [Chloroflexota bacterium]